MSFNQWKLLNHLRDTVGKLANEKNIQNPFSRDFLQVFHKLPFSLYKNDVIKYFETKTKVLETFVKDRDYFYSLSTNLAKRKGEGQQKSMLRKWQSSEGTKSNVIFADIDHLLCQIGSSENEQLLLDAIEQLISHIKEHPEARNKAVKSAAIRRVLRAKSKTKNEQVQGAIRELLSILGYAAPVPGRGIRILAIDGGGVRGLLVLEMLKKLEELTGKRVHELFDYFCGVSTGSILSFSMGIHLRPLDEIISSYEALSKEVFSQSAVWGTGSLVWSHAYYDTSLWEKKLREYLGSDILITTSRNPQCPKLSCISAVVNQTRLSAFVFRNYTLPWRVQSHYPGSHTDEVWQAARASAAAPTYFHEYKLGSLLHQDGGILVNNPTAIALHEAKLLWPNTSIQCVVSFGTGRTIPTPMELNKHSHSQITRNLDDDTTVTTSWTGKFYKILDSATDTEAVHIMLSDLLPENVYYRFNPFLTEMIGMVENDPRKLEQLRRDALMYLRRNEDKFQEAAKTLTLKKNYMQKLSDDVVVTREMYGI